MNDRRAVPGHRLRPAMRRIPELFLHRGRQRAVILYVVLSVMGIVAATAALFFASFRVRDQEIRLSTDEAVARFLARGAVEILAYCIERDLEKGPSAAIDLEGGSIRDVVLADGPGLERLFERRTRGSDHRAFLEQLVGTTAFGWIDKMAQPYGQLRFTYRVSAKASERPKSGLVDPVIKHVDLDVEVRCRLHHSDQIYQQTLTIFVRSLLAQVVSRFCLVATDLDLVQINRQVVDRTGKPILGPPVLACLNSAGDLPASETLLGEPTMRVRPIGSARTVQTVAELKKRLESRGASYLSLTDPDSPLTLRIASGGVPLGQHFQMYPPVDGKTTYPSPRPIEPQPSLIENARPAEPGTGVKQKPIVEGVVTGHHQGIDPQGLMGPAGSGETYADDAVSFIRPLGTAAHPSEGLVYGNILAGVAAKSNLCVDRDATDADENEQRQAVGQSLPERESADPALKNASQHDFDADLEREKNSAHYESLLAFGSPDLGPGRVHNLNLHVARPDGGVLTVSSELTHEPISLDLSEYRYGKLFKTYDTYSKTMSKRLNVPYNTLLRGALADSEPAQAFAQRLAFGTVSATELSDALLTEALWLHTDDLHRRIEKSLGDRRYVDTTVTNDKEKDKEPVRLLSLIKMFVGTPIMPRSGMECRGVPFFRTNFMAKGGLDLGDCVVMISPEKKGQPPPEVDLGDAIVLPGGGGVLLADSVVMSSLKNTGTGRDYIPLTIVARSIRLRGPGPFEGIIVPIKELNLVGDHDHTRIVGTFAPAPIALSQIAKPLAVVRESRGDPTGPDAHLSYRAQIIHGAAPRVYGFGDQLVDASTYRREPDRKVGNR